MKSAEGIMNNVRVIIKPGEGEETRRIWRRIINKTIRRRRQQWTNNRNNEKRREETNKLRTEGNKEERMEIRKEWREGPEPWHFDSKTSRLSGFTHLVRNI